ncbi:hypothetical protein MNAN1_000394a [Malassezia nana]|uniref:Uncharacterized protein n=1 Tax=Malassezia nana TaxID=180528 RepID=A0AAF0J2B3_9BASI|nr:hypothetical protein MNAN1_000394a [Malassezia nana]
MPKAELVKALMEQRFDLRHPHAHIDTVATFHPMPISDVFLLSHEFPAFFDVLRRTHANASMDKRESETGVTITGDARATEQVRAWLDGFQTSIHTVRLPFQVPDELLRWISYHTQCHVANQGTEVCLRYRVQEHADQARMLLEEHSHWKPIHGADVWLFTPTEAQGNSSWSSLPFSPGTITEPLLLYALHQTTWSRITGPTSDAPLDLVPVTPSTHAFPMHRLEEIRSAIPHLPISLVAGEWSQNTHTTFGHMLWDQVPADTSDLSSLPNPGRFLVSSPPSCMEGAPFLPNWKELEYDEQQLERLYYRAALPQGTMDLVLTLDTTSAPMWQSATWMSHAATYVLCPALPVDMQVTVSMEAPLPLSALEDTPLPAYLDHVTRVRAMEMGKSAYEALSQDESPSQASLPLSLQLSAPKGPVSLHLWRTEQVTEHSSTYYHPEHNNPLSLKRRTVRCNSMPHFGNSVVLSMPTWPGNEMVQSLLQSPYPALGQPR